MNLLENNKSLLTLPAFFSFLVTLLLLFKFSYPISWDVYYHIHMINVYLENGLVFWDYLTVAPRGRLVMYPPIFHLFFAYLCNILNVSAVELCELSQPVFSAILIGSITFATYKLVDVKTAFFTGFLSLFCFITFNRSVICTPATIAIVLFLISFVYCFRGIEHDNVKEIIVSAMSLAIIWNLHMATAILATGIIGLYFIILIINKKGNVRFFLYYLLIVLCVGFPWWIYITLNYGLVFNSLGANNTLISDFFFKYYGIIPTLCLILGYYVLIKEKSNLSIFLIVSSLALFLLSQVNYLGFHTVSIRIMEILSYILIIISGIGLSYIYDNKIKGIRVKKVLIIMFVLLSVLSSLLYVDSYTPDLLAENDANSTVIGNDVHLFVNPVVSIFKPTLISSRFADVTLAHDRYEVMEYFVNLNSNHIVVSEDAVMDTIIVSTSRTPVIYGGFTESIPEYVVNPMHIVKGESNKEELHELGIGYLLLKQNTPVPYYAELIKENNNYIICKIKEDFR